MAGVGAKILGGLKTGSSLLTGAGVVVAGVGATNMYISGKDSLTADVIRDLQETVGGAGAEANAGITKTSLFSFLKMIGEVLMVLSNGKMGSGLINLGNAGIAYDSDKDPTGATFDASDAAALAAGTAGLAGVGAAGYKTYQFFRGIGSDPSAPTGASPSSPSGGPSGSGGGSTGRGFKIDPDAVDAEIIDDVADATAKGKGFKMGGVKGNLAVMGVVGAGTYIASTFNGSSTAEAAETAVTTAVPFADAANKARQGDIEGAELSAAQDAGGLAGFAGGAAGGAALGAAAGSVVPIVGTAIGGVVGGLVGGVAGSMGGSWAGGKIFNVFNTEAEGAPKADNFNHALTTAPAPARLDYAG